MLLMIDNYDSFTYNLVQYFYQLGQEIEVHRNDLISLDDIEKKSPEYIVISPGPCTPKEAGISVELIKKFKDKLPILGVCLESPFKATRYHSLIIEENTLEKEFLIKAWTENKTIMAIQHEKLPLFGLQFHPESIATEQGMEILKNFLNY